MTIIVFDSGVGGLSVLREARMLIHNQQFIYVGDDAGFPYGDWEGEALTHRIA
ncbi:MAG: glutamate racemase, partial [Granulosicoccus sp.]